MLDPDPDVFARREGGKVNHLEDSASFSCSAVLTARRGTDDK